MNLKKLFSLFLLFNLATNTCAVSIDDLFRQGKIPAIRNNMLNLSGLEIDSLVGLEKIPSIATLEGLSLNNNKLTMIFAQAFAVCPRLKVLGLKDNKITFLDDDALMGLDVLEVLYLENNQLKDLPAQVLNRLPLLKFVGVRNNPLSKGDIKDLKKALRHVEVSTALITQKQLLTLGIAVATVALAVAVALGVRQYTKKESPVALAIQAEATARDKEREGMLGQARDLWQQAQAHWEEAKKVWDKLSVSEKMGAKEPGLRATESKAQADRIEQIIKGGGVETIATQQLLGEDDVPPKTFQTAENLEGQAAKAGLLAQDAVAAEKWQEAQSRYLDALNYWTKARNAWRKLGETGRASAAGARAQEVAGFVNEATAKLREAKASAKK